MHAPLQPFLSLILAANTNVRSARAAPTAHDRLRHHSIGQAGRIQQADQYLLQHLIGQNLNVNPHTDLMLKH